MKAILFPTWPARYADGAVLALRLLVGLFLVWGVWDNIASPARMAEFESFLRGLHCPLPQFAAPVSVYAQFAAGVGLCFGLLTRWAGLLMALNFIVAVILLWPSGDPRTLFPPGVLIPVGLVFFTQGAGRLALDAFLSQESG